MKIKDEVLAVLSTLKVDGSEVRIVDQLERPLYVKVNEVLEACGGKWNKKAKAHLFEGDAAEKLEAVMLTGEVTRDKDIGFFETPANLADLLVGMAGVKPGQTVLEPSAGKGRIVQALRAVGAKVIAVEADSARRADLRYGHGSDLGKNTPHIMSDATDFFDVTPSKIQGHQQNDGRCSIGPVDAVVMNPPFGRTTVNGKTRDHIDHVMHAFTFLKAGGRLVSVMPSSVTFRNDKRYVEFRKFVEESNGSIKALRALSFRESGADVNTCVVKIPA